MSRARREGGQSVATVRGARGERRAWSAGFTLVELLVAVAAVALMTVGIAQVFSLTGRTVASGRRLATLNTYASLLERQLRADVAGMTREGFLVIRNELATGGGVGTGVQLSALDTNPRKRRIDELMFFTRGSVQTAREPLHPTRTARSAAARVYYGHGMRFTPPADGSRGSYQTPQVDDAPALGDALVPVALGEKPAVGVSPNQFASDWTLLRHVTVLAKPSQADEGTLSNTSVQPVLGSQGANWVDSPVQVGLQPAAASIFRSLAGLVQASGIAKVRTADANRRPLFSSGIVDVAATDLAEIRATMMGARVGVGVGAATMYPIDTFNQFLGGDQVESWSGVPARQRVQEWMTDAMPAASDPKAAPITFLLSGNGVRMRYEDDPPSYRGPTGGWASTEADYRRADQLMLTASNFLPHCTEFIVEWTFGQLDQQRGGGTGVPATLDRPIWHGLTREVRLNPARAAFDAATDYQVVPYGFDTNKPLMTQTVALNTGGSEARLVFPELIHGQGVLRNSTLVNQGPLYSYFGYIDTTYSPTVDPYTGQPDPNALLVDVHPPDASDPNKGPPTYDPGEGDKLKRPDTVPWMWPTQLRLIIRLADPGEATVENTYEFTIAVPGGGSGGTGTK